MQSETRSIVTIAMTSEEEKRTKQHSLRGSSHGNAKQEEILSQLEEQLTDAGFEANRKEHRVLKEAYKAKLESLRNRFPSANIRNSRVELFKPIPVHPPKALQNQTKSSSQCISFDYNEYFNDDDVVYLDVVRTADMISLPRAFVRAGPRELLHFNPSQVNAAIVTCGGFCPGINNVIRELTHSLYSVYGVHQVWGIHGGFRGFLGFKDLRRNV